MSIAADDPVALLGRLIAFDTTSYRSNLELIACVGDFLGRLGISSRRIANHDGSKAALIASVGPETANGVVLSGHTDVVPVTGQEWSSDPFELTARGDYLHGRGATDMKGFIAAVLARVPEWSRLPLLRPIHIVLSYDEEVGCLAQPILVQRLLESVPPPAVTIVGEPSEMQVVGSHRGIRVFETQVTGRTGHSGAPEHGVNAIVAAARCIERLDALNMEFASEADAGSERTTINVGMVDGGTAVNVIPQRADFTWECRPLTDADAERIRSGLDGFVAGELLPELRRISGDAAVETRETIGVPPLQVEPDSPAMELALALSDHGARGTVPFASEAGFFQRAGVPTVVCGPGSAAQAHQPDEYIHRDQLFACMRFLHRLGERLTVP